MHQPVTLVLLPGLDGTNILFRPFVQALPQWIRPLCIEYPITGPNDYATLLPIVREACKNLDDFVILGWSFSGPLALMAAAESPPGLRGVVLCATFIETPWPLLRWLRAAAKTPLARTFSLFSKLLSLGGGYDTPELTAAKRELFGRVPPAAMAARAREILGIDVRDELRSCPVPVMYLGGSSDVVVPWWNAKAVKAAVSSAEVVIIAGPHLALHTNPVEAARVVARFMAPESSARGETK